MRRDILAAAVLLGPVAVFAAGGCAGRPLMDNPAFVPAAAVPGPCPNPVFLAGGPPEYGAVFEGVLSVVDDYFEIMDANRYAGVIRTHPKVAPGLGEPWKPGSPDGAERLLATLQSMRYRCDVTIQPITPDAADPRPGVVPAGVGGYLVTVIVYKELEDVPRPIKATAGAAAFRSDNSVDRQFEVVDPSVVDTAWIPKGREVSLEQEILKRIMQQVKKCVPGA
ncbi:MAG TPA: hypothetical protein VGF55_03960 [Gemmataceae bacterium]|jgi:hypothetical protein